MRNMFLLLGVLLLTTSCLSIDGNLAVRESFVVKKKSGFLNLKTKSQTVSPGTYRAQFIAKSSKKLELELRGGSLGKIDIPLKSERDLNLPSNGPFFIAGSSIEQPIDISGTIRTDIQRYGYSSRLVRCEISRTEKKCEKVCNKETGKCESICRDVTTTYQGEKEVHTHLKRTDIEVHLELMKERSNIAVASFGGREVKTEEIIDRETSCR